MSEVMKDSAIKLFGKTITLLPDQVVAEFSVSEQRQSSFSTSTSQDSKSEISGEDFTENRHESESINPTKETLTTEAATSSEISDDTDTPQTPKKEETSDQSNASQEKTTLQKPDKILPCPRCNSMDTKFCYYNNYNVNQPRYFCKNCQRYWTSGGTMRNVPVGSGRRKSKNAVFPDFRHIMVADTLQAARVDAINGIHLSSLKPNGFLIGGFPVSFYPYSESAAPNCWNAPLVSSAASICPNSSLGKHSREGNMVRTSNLGKENLDGERERSVLIPKTLRIHDPSEAAKSSIWSTLGIKREKNGSFSGRGIFKAFESKGDRGVDNTTLVLQANPAALCRSINFRESA